MTPAVVAPGNEQIGERIGSIVRVYGMQLVPTGPVIQLGRTVAEATSVPGSPDEGFVLVHRLDPQGRIAHQWVLPSVERSGDARVGLTSSAGRGWEARVAPHASGLPPPLLAAAPLR